MSEESAVQPDMSADETRELARLAAAWSWSSWSCSRSSAIAISWARATLRRALGAAVNVAAGRCSCSRAADRFSRATAAGHRSLLVAVVLLGVLVLGPDPAARSGPRRGPDHGRLPSPSRSSTAAGSRSRLVAAFVVSVAAAIMVELTPASPDLPPELAAALRVGAMAAVTGLVGLVLYRHRRRLERAVTRAQAAGEALRDSEARYRTVVEDVREVIFRIDGEGRWALLNRAWEELTGHPVADSLGRPILDFVHPDDRENHADLVQPVAGGRR